jgi:hypothetical protein
MQGAALLSASLIEGALGGAVYTANHIRAFDDGRNFISAVMV